MSLRYVSMLETYVSILEVIFTVVSTFHNDSAFDIFYVVLVKNVFMV